MDRKKLQTYEPLIKSLGQLCTIIRLYNFGHPMIKDRLHQAFTEVSKMISQKQSLTFSESEGVFLVNGKQIEVKGIIERFTANLNKLQLGSVELKPGLTLEEFHIFMRLLSQVEKLQGEEQIKQYLKEKGVQHVIPLFAVYKLVKEDEEIMKEEEIIKVDELPSGIAERLRQDLEKGEVGKRLKKERGAYKLLAHDPVFLFRTIFDAVKKNDNIEEFKKTLWVIADYLIGEVSSGRIEKINQKVLDGLKNRLLSLWEQREDKGHWKEETQKAFTEIIVAMQLKGLLLLYRRHKKGLEAAAKELKDILEALPAQSRLYQRTRGNLEKIGAPCLDVAILRLLQAKEKQKP